MAEHQESPHKTERRKNSGGEPGSLTSNTKKKEALKCVEEESDEEKTRLKQKYREKKNAANKAVAKARDDKQLEWCKRIEEDWETCIFKLAIHRDRDSKDTTQTSALKRSDGTLVTGVKTSARCMGGVFQETIKPGGRM